MKPSFGYLKHDSNSCYMDTVLFMLLAIPNDFIDTHILNSTHNLSIRNSLISIKNSIKNGEKITCAEFKKLLSSKGNYEDFNSDDMQSSEEFLRFLFSLFNVTPCTTIKYTFVTNTSLPIDISSPDVLLTSKYIDKHSSPIFDISPTSVPNMNLVSLIKNYEDSGILDENNLFTPDEIIKKGKTIKNKEKFHRRIESTIPMNFEYLVLNLKRHTFSKFIDTPVIPNKIIKLPHSKILKLTGIIVWVCRHYLLFFNHEEDWYLYNDFFGIRKFGDYDYIIKNNDVLTHGVMFFYT